MPERGRVLFLAVLLLTVAILAGGCMHLTRVEPGARPQDAYQGVGGPELARQFAPLLVTHGWEQPYNRIGRPVASYNEYGQEQISMDPAQPAMYWRAVAFRTARGSYTNLIYRVHFPSVPVSLIPFFISAGQNMGLFVVITLDQDLRPVLVTTLATCGCYTSLTPTTYTPRSAYPPGWQDRPAELYGETLPARLSYKDIKKPRLVVEIRPGEHRVMGLRVIPGAAMEDARRFRLHQAKLIPAEALWRLPLGQGTTSLFYESGMLEGHVKGAWKPFETLFIGWWCLDGVVGMDKAYGVKANPLYTSLKPWNRLSSDMNDFPEFLRFWGWGLQRI